MNPHFSQQQHISSLPLQPTSHPRHQPHHIHPPSQPHHPQQPPPQQSQAPQSQTPPPVTYSAERVVGSGSFGVVYQARVVDPVTGVPGETVAIKKVYLDPEYKNRELQILSELDHPSIVGLRHCFYAQSAPDNKTYINLVMDFLPDTIHKAVRNHARSRSHPPVDTIRYYIYQIIRGLAYIHHKGICHRDLKPQNILLDEVTRTVRICDFGSAKRLSATEQNVAYICSRYYRAPELALGARIYSTAVDIWSAGCVFAELLLGKPLFAGDSSEDQILRILTVLGYPKSEDYDGMGLNEANALQTIQACISHLNKTRQPRHDASASQQQSASASSSQQFSQLYSEAQFANPTGLRELLGPHIPQEAVDLLATMLHYDPQRRTTAFEALSHPFFNPIHCFTYQTLDPTQHAWEISHHNWTETECTLIGQLPLHKRAVLFPYWLRDRIPRKLQQLANFDDIETFNCIRYMLQLQHNGFQCTQPQPMSPQGAQQIQASQATPQNRTTMLSQTGSNQQFPLSNAPNGTKYFNNGPQGQQYYNQSQQQQYPTNPTGDPASYQQQQQQQQLYLQQQQQQQQQLYQPQQTMGYQSQPNQNYQNYSANQSNLASKQARNPGQYNQNTNHGTGMYDQQQQQRSFDTPIAQQNTEMTTGKNNNLNNSSTLPAQNQSEEQQQLLRDLEQKEGTM